MLAITHARRANNASTVLNTEISLVQKEIAKICKSDQQMFFSEFLIRAYMERSGLYSNIS